MRKVSRNVKVQLEQAVDSALQRGNHHGWALVMMVFCRCKGGAGVGLFPAGGVSTRCRDLAAAGCNARSCYSRGARLPALLGRYSPQSWCIFKWTSLFILFVAAGLAAGAIRAFHEAGLWNHFQEIAFDMSAVLSTHSLFGTLMEGILAIRKRQVSAKSPSGLFISSRRWWHLLCHHAQGRQRLALRSKYDANSCLVTTYFKGIVSS